MSSPTKDLLDRIARVSGALGISERKLCNIAGLKSESHLAATRSRDGDMGWNHLGRIVLFLYGEHGVPLEFLFLGKLPMVRSGSGADAVKVSPIVRRKPTGEAQPPSDVAPGAAKNRRRA